MALGLLIGDTYKYILIIKQSIQILTNILIDT